MSSKKGIFETIDETLIMMDTLVKVMHTDLTDAISRIEELETRIEHHADMIYNKLERKKNGQI